MRPRLGQGEAEPAIFGKINMGLNMLQSLLLPFAMLPMLHFTGSVAVMGRFAGSFRVRAVTALCAVLVSNPNPNRNPNPKPQPEP